jgi:hypothetical protein
LAAFAAPLFFAAGCGPIGGDVSGASSGDGSSGGSLPPTGPDGGILMAPGGYCVIGNQVLDAKGKPHLFRGLDRPSLEWSAGGSNLALADYQHMGHDWHANLVRLSLNQDFWLNDAANTLYDSAYADRVDQQVHFAEANGMDVILDLHWSDQGDYTRGAACLMSGGCQQCMADQHSVTFWQQVAQKYAGDGHVLFELYNEPHDVGWSTWRDGGTSGSSCKQNSGNDFQVAGMQQLYETVRATGANNLVIVGGLNWAYDLTGVPGSRITGYNVIYNTHPYSYKCGGTCGSGNFDGAFGFLASTDPVIATEFGNGDCSDGFYTTFTQYAQTKGIHWTAWAYYVADCKFPSVISDWDGTPMGGSGMVVQSALIASQTTPGGVPQDGGAVPDM